MLIFVVKLLGSISTITGGMVSLGPPVGVIVEAHFVSSAPPKSITIAIENRRVMLRNMFSSLFFIALSCQYPRSPLLVQVARVPRQEMGLPYPSHLPDHSSYAHTDVAV